MFFFRKNKLSESLKGLLYDIQSVYKVEKYSIPEQNIGKKSFTSLWSLWTPEGTIHVTRFYKGYMVHEDLQGATAYHHPVLEMTYIYFPQIRVITKIQHGRVVSCESVPITVEIGGNHFIERVAEMDYKEKIIENNFENS